MNQQEALFEYTLRLGDNALILGHRLSEWCGHGPILEEDIALTNIALDHIGQSRTLLSYAGQVEGKGRTEDDLAYFRSPEQFRNAMLVELSNGDFAGTIARQFLYSTFAALLFTELKNSKDTLLAGYAEKSLKETLYHVRHSAEWMIRLGDGTEESKSRLQNGLDDLSLYIDDLFSVTDGDNLLIAEGIIPDVLALRPKWDAQVQDVLAKATVTLTPQAFQITGSRDGKHTEHLSYLLGELQYLQRTMPGMEW